VQYLKADQIVEEMKKRGISAQPEDVYGFILRFLRGENWKTGILNDELEALKRLRLKGLNLVLKSSVGYEVFHSAVDRINELSGGPLATHYLHLSKWMMDQIEGYMRLVRALHTAENEWVLIDDNPSEDVLKVRLAGCAAYYTRQGINIPKIGEEIFVQSAPNRLCQNMVEDLSKRSRAHFATSR
jgi:hypothetical protein